MPVNPAEPLSMILTVLQVFVLPTAIIAFIAYWVIRKAIKDALKDFAHLQELKKENGK